MLKIIHLKILDANILKSCKKCMKMDICLKKLEYKKLIKNVTDTMITMGL